MPFSAVEAAVSAANGESSSPLLDVTNVGRAEKYLASPDGAADPPLLRV
jgi:hypothetical protein